MCKITDKLKNTKIFVPTNAKAVEVQELLFSLGFKWGSGDRTPIHSLFASEAQAGGGGMIYNFNAGAYLCVDSNCRISWYPAAYKPTVHKFQIVMSQLREIVAEFKEAKKARKKQQRAKKNPWIANTGVCPVKEGEKVDVKYFNGHIEYDIIALTFDAREGQKLTAISWEIPSVPYDTNIQYYRIVKLQPVVIKKDKTITQDELVSRFAVEKGAKTVSFEVAGLTGHFVDSAVLDEHAEQMDTNPKKQFGDKSIPLNLWPALASAYGSIGLYNGKLKYGANNFKATPVEASVYISAAKRHLEAWAEGEEFDPADGVPNLAGVLANIAILLESRAQGTMIDDRNLGTGYLKERDSLKEIVASLQVIHAGKTPKHYYKTEVK